MLESRDLPSERDLEKVFDKRFPELPLHPDTFTVRPAEKKTIPSRAFGSAKYTCPGES